MFKRKFIIKLSMTVVIVWGVLIVKLAIDASVPSLQAPLSKMLYGSRHQLRKNVGYFVGDRRQKYWSHLEFLPNYTEVKMKFGQGMYTIGENGEAFQLDIKSMSEKEQKKIDKGFSRFAYHEYVGNLVSVRRKLPDARIQECKDKTYPENLPKTSIIICFYNEAWTSLLRTIHSIIDRTPDNLIEEIILVDDNSTFDYLKDPLEEYMSQFAKVKIIKTQRREGLIRARLFGYNHTSPRAAIVTFLDAHIECLDGWLEPMLEPIMKNNRMVTMPTISSIHDMTFGHITGQPSQVGMFTFPGGRFAWMNTPERENRRRQSLSDDIRSPAMAGGLFSIHKAFFNFIGTYDEELDIWGGENIELSVKIWMCGGTLLLSPCSHVGHVFRKRLPYAGGFHELMRNLGRVVNVWFDEYNVHFQNYEGKLQPFSDIHKRVEFRKKLQCKSFHWYRKTVFPEMYFIGSGVNYGSIQNEGEPNICIDAGSVKRGKAVSPYPCHGGYNQKWDFTEAMDIRVSFLCLEFSGFKFTTAKCDGWGSQSWKYRGKKIQNRESKFCIGLSKDSSQLQMQICDGRPMQLWNWKKVREPFIKDFFRYL